VAFLVSDPEAFWLDVTNAGLGLVALACVVVVIVAVVVEFAGRARRRAHIIANADAGMRAMLGVADQPKA
jgi:hypothetical protein